MRRLTTVSVFLFVLATAPIPALAQSPHYKAKGGPNCVDNGLTATCTGTVTGLGNFNVEITLSASASGSTVCKNPGNGSEVPGQNPALNVPVSGGLFIPASSIKNGNLSFTVTTLPPPNPTPAQAGCPNGNWTASYSDLTFSNGSLSVFQDLNGDGVFSNPGEIVIGPTPVSIP
jgi:hypothetical protein